MRSNKAGCNAAGFLNLIPKIKRLMCINLSPGKNGQSNKSIKNSKDLLFCNVSYPSVPVAVNSNGKTFEYLIRIQDGNNKNRRHMQHESRDEGKRHNDQPG